MAELVGLNEAGGSPFTIRIPSTGEVFRPPSSTTGELYYRENNQLQATNLESLGEQLFVATTEKPTYGHLSPSERQGLGKQVLQAQGINYEQIPQQNYNLADVRSYFGKQGAVQPLIDLSNLGKAVKSTTLVPKSNLSISGGTLEGLNNAQQKEFQDVMSGLSQGTQGGATFTRTPRGILDNRTDQIIQSTTSPTANVTPDNLGVSVQIRNLESKIDNQLTNLKAGLSSGGATEILQGLFTKFGVAENQSILKEYNQQILSQQKLLREIPDNIKTTLQDVGISEAQYNRIVLKETQEPLETLRGLMEQKGAAEEAINNSLRFIGLFSDAALKDQATKLELAKFEISTNKDLLSELNATQRKFVDAALDERKDDIKRVQDAADAARQNGAKDVSYILSSPDGDTALERLAASGFGAKATEEWSAPYSLGGDIVQKNTKTGEIRTAVNVPKAGDSDLSVSERTAIRESLSSYLTGLQKFKTREEALTNIQKDQTKIVLETGQNGLAVLLDEVDKIFPPPKSETKESSFLDLITGKKKSSGLTGYKEPEVKLAPSALAPDISGADFSPDARKAFTDNFYSTLFGG